MQTIQITIDEALLAQVDNTIQELGTTRSAFIRDALRLALRELKIASLEREHMEGYTRKPVQAGEFDLWEPEQVWGDS